MSSVIIAGATGDLGGRVVKHLLDLGANVRCLVRPGSHAEKVNFLATSGAEIVTVDYSDFDALTKACAGGSVALSTVSGLRPVIVDFQSRLLNAAVAAGVPRFIPSDFAVDYRPIPAGENRNLNLREEFRRIVDAQAGIRATSILNGAFMDMLTGVAPFILFPVRRILCWGDPEQKLDWTSIDDTARFTAYAALDDAAPRYLSIAGNVVSAGSLASLMSEISGKPYRVMRPGSPRLLASLVKITRFFAPEEGQVYPAWQGMQYMHSMYSGVCKLGPLDNERYPVRFTSVRALLSGYLNGSVSKYQPKS
jgi:uncharacterized protein YbjT (DUF2867 family)